MIFDDEFYNDNSGDFDLGCGCGEEGCTDARCAEEDDELSPFFPEYDEDDDGFEDDGQPSEYDEWQDFMGGDDWDHGQYDEFC